MSFLSPSSALAQTDVVEETEIKRAKQQIRMDASIRKALEAARARQALETGETVTYQDILKDPDNINLNYRYAQAQMQRGELTGAAATLERILMINPDLAPIRLSYGIVLFQLDNLDEAEREFSLLDDAELPEPVRKQTSDYLKAIRQRRQTTKLVMSTTIGWGFDDNRNASPSAKRRLLADAPVVLTGNAKKRRDTNFLVVNGLSFRHDLGSQAGHELLGSFDYYLGEQTSADDLDLQSFSASGGVLLKTPIINLTPKAFANYLHLSRETFLRSQGAKLEASRALGKRFSIAGGGTWTEEEYTGIIENTTAPERDGHRVALNFAGKYTLTPTTQLGLGLGYENKDVDKPEFEYNAYQGLSVTGSHTWLLGKGQFLLSSVAYTLNSYDIPDSSISAMKRRDKQVRARMNYGAPVSFLLQPVKALTTWLPETALENLTASVNIEWFRSMSNIVNYTYTNHKYGFMFTKRFEL